MAHARADPTSVPDAQSACVGLPGVGAATSTVHHGRVIDDRFRPTTGTTPRRGAQPVCRRVARASPGMRPCSTGRHVAELPRAAFLLCRGGAALHSPGPCRPGPLTVWQSLNSRIIAECKLPDKWSDSIHSKRSGSFRAAPPLTAPRRRRPTRWKPTRCLVIAAAAPLHCRRIPCGFGRGRVESLDRPGPPSVPSFRGRTPGDCDSARTWRPP